MKNLIYLVTIILFITSSVYAESQKGNNQNQNRDKMKKIAKKLGYDLNSETGRASFREHMKKRRDKMRNKAKEMGYDLKSESGRKSFRNEMKNRRDNRK